MRAPHRKQMQAASLLQKAWKRRFSSFTTPKLVDRYLATGPSASYVKGISFERLTVFLREKPTIRVAKDCLQRIHLLTTFRHGSPTTAPPSNNVNVRLFLAGMMVAYRPTHVFQTIGPLEDALLMAATSMFTVFEKILHIVKTEGSFQKVPHALSGRFPGLLFTYLHKFKEWKVVDEARILCRIKHALILLIQVQERMSSDEPEDSQIMVELRTQIDQLYVKLRQIAGEAAVKEFDEQRALGLVTTKFGEDSTDSGRMTNETMAHEMNLDPNFKIEESGRSDCPIFQKIRESFHQAFWDSMTDELMMTTPVYTRMLRVLGEIKDGLAKLGAHSLDSILDMDYIKTQAEQGLYQWASCTALIESIVRSIECVQTRARDEETRTKWAEMEARMQDAGPEEQPRAFSKALEFLLERIFVLRVDEANGKLLAIRDVIKCHGIDYERGKFQDKLDRGDLTLERTTSWIGACLKHEVASRAVELSDLLEGKAPAIVHVHSEAMVSLVADKTTITKAMCPETLLLDARRLNGLQREYHCLVTAMTMIVTASHTILGARDLRNLPVLSAISALFVSEEEMVLEAMVDNIRTLLLGSSLSEANQKTLLRALFQCASPTDAVHGLMATRMRTLWGLIMKNGRVPADFNIVNAARCLIPRIEKAAAKLLAVAKLNRTVHIGTYNQLIGEGALGLGAEA